jgi:uncharacterized repeat protein (TIGR01451 family)
MPSPLLRRRRSVAVVAAFSISGLLLTGTTTSFRAVAANEPVAGNGTAVSEPAGESTGETHDVFGEEGGLNDRDNRVGQFAPTSAAKSRVDALGARVEWNRYGTPASLIKKSGYLATGLSTNAVTAARSFVSANRALFRLSATGLNNLELLNDSKLTGSPAHVVLFRQRFGSLPAAQDGMISVGVVDGKVAYVSSSAVGDGNAPAAAELQPTAAWQVAAASVGRAAADTAISGVRQEHGWTVFAVDGFTEPQRARLVALPTPSNGVRPAFETIVYPKTASGEEHAYTVFVDAKTKDVLFRTNRTSHASTGMPAGSPTQAGSLAMAPTVGTFSGSFEPPACGRSAIQVPAGTKTINVAVATVPPGEDIVIKLLDPSGTEVASADSPTGPEPEVITYSPGGVVPAGEYTVEVCPFTATQDPADYEGVFSTSEQSLQAFPFPPKWKYFTANPPLNGDDTDTRIVGCFTRADAQTDPNNALPAGCQREEGNTAARQPWDVDGYTSLPTFTTLGNAARTAEAWFNFRGPGPLGQMPISAEREYIYPWTDQWRNQKCSPTVFETPQRNDIDAATTNLFVEHNRMHDWSYFLGFTENNFNMQFNNFGNTAPDRQNDPEVGQSQAGAVNGGFPAFNGRDNANQTTLNDGIPGITNMYLWQPLPGAFYASCTDGDYDQSVIGHEYTHAISNRMVGGPDAGLTSSADGQARAMGESYSDLTAVEYLLEYKYVPTADENPFAVGPYVTGNNQAGIRNYGMNNSPLNFSDVQGYDGSGVASPHDDGEIWSAVNYDIRQAMIAKYNGRFPASNRGLQERCADGVLPATKCPGNRRWMQIVFDAYLMMPPSVSMLGSRDAYLGADLLRFGGANQKVLWDNFARRGFGEKASTTTTDDPQPIANFESARSTNEATITFKPVTAAREPIKDVRIYVGDYEGRVTPIADTVANDSDPATPEFSNTAKFLPGRYDFVVQAPGYGLTRTTWNFKASTTTHRVFLLVPNTASVHRGATITGDGANLRSLIDDTERTNFVSGRPGSTTGGTVGNDADKVAGRQFTVDLAGNKQLVDVVKVSALLRSGAPCEGEEECDPQDNSQNRFSALRQFAIEACTASAGNNKCQNRSTVGKAGDGFNRIFTSRPEAFPASVPRPLAPSLIFREFDVPDTKATHVRMVVISNQCTGNPEYHGDQDNDPNVNSDCRTDGLVAAPDEAVIAPQDTTVRAAELQVFSAGGDGGGGSGSPQDPFVTFTKTGPLTADQGETISYTMDYTNLGPAASEQVKITDQLPKGVSFVSASGPDSYNATTRTVTWRLGTVDVLEDGSVRLKVQVNNGVDTGAVLTNTATFEGALTTATPAVAATVVL